MLGWPLTFTLIELDRDRLSTVPLGTPFAASRTRQERSAR